MELALKIIQSIVFIVSLIVMIAALGFGAVLLYLGFKSDFHSDGPGGIVFWFGPPLSFLFAWTAWIFVRGTAIELFFRGKS